MAEFKISRFKYNWKGSWDTNASYIPDDVISYGGKTYVCVLLHDASANFYTDLNYLAPGNTIVTPRWVIMTDGVKFRGNWTTGTFYNIGDLVLLDGFVYNCTLGHLAGSTFADNSASWTTYVASQSYKGNWAASAHFNLGAVIFYGGNAYRCTVEHTASVRFETDQSLGYWILEYSGVDYKGPWIIYTRYKVGDLVDYGSNIWRCIEGHDGAFNPNQWELYVPGQKYVGVWSNTTSYVTNDLVRHGGNIYSAKLPLANSASYSGMSRGYTVTASGNQNYIFAGSAIGNDPTLSVIKGDVLTFSVNAPGHPFYIQSVTGTGGGNLVSGVTGQGSAVGTVVFNTATVAVGTYYYQCGYHGQMVGSIIVTDPATTVMSNDGKSPGSYTEFWDLVVESYSFKGNWSAAVSYGPGDLVRRGGQLYVALKDSLGIEPSNTATFDGSTLGTAHWQISIPGQNWKGPWAEGVDYGYGDVIQFDSNTYQCIVSHVSDATTYPDNGNYTFDYWSVVALGSVPNALSRQGDLVVRDTSIDGSTLQNNRVRIGSADQSLVVSPVAGAQHAVDTFVIKMVDPIPPETLVKYYVNDEYRASLELLVGNTYVFDQSYDALDGYYSLNGHPVLFSTTVDGEWTLGGARYDDNVVYKIDNKAVTYDQYSDVAVRAAANKISVMITITETTPTTLYYYCDYHPNEGGVLTIKNPGTSVYYTTFGAVRKTYYVAPDGVDLVYGRAENTTDQTRYGSNPETPWKTVRFATENVIGPALIKVAPGKYYETLPIIVPEDVSIYGDELRATELTAGLPIAVLAGDSAYTIAVLRHIKDDVIPLLMTNTAVTVSAGNTVSQVTSLPVAGSLSVTIDIQFRIQDIIDYITYKISNGAQGSNPSVFGKNTQTSVDAYRRAYAILKANREFIAQEAVAYQAVTNPGYSFDHDKCARDTRNYIDAWLYDILYTGNYKSILAARYYINAIKGSAAENFFLVRNSTTIRNLSLSGLVGVLTPPTIVDLDRRPTGGAYVSLDPGWGPNDTRTWITTRSPYIQNVTTFGYGAVGQKIDGALHNGGNKSIVSNDFTQVISDGVGAWVTNQGRVELVSVFSYYAHIGYLCENGGVIRGTNGNSSYGNYGAVAYGTDNTETPMTGTLNNRTTQATVKAVFAGEASDEILKVEMNHGGENYTSSATTYSITGAGYGATFAFEEIRDNAVFQARVQDAGDSQGVGGSGYQEVRNNAQSGDLTTITLAASDQGTDSAYIGMKIIITSGTGTGQYGYIQSYSSISKIATIYKESTGTIGWDHVQPGRALKNPLDTTTFYTIEPRLIFSHPGFTATSSTFPSTVDWSSIRFGTTTETFASLAGTAGSGNTNGVPAQAARFTVVKTGTTYAVTVPFGGAGYSVGDTIKILGTSLSGQTPTNDLTITVTGISNDSTNSILTISYTGSGWNGRFVATSNAGDNVVSSSIDGVTWVQTTLPNTAGAATTPWILGHGNNKFVALRQGTPVGATSGDGKTWLAVTLPVSGEWTDITHGNGTFVAVSRTGNHAIYSTDDGATWTRVALPDVVADSTIGDWVGIRYGKNKFVAICRSTNGAAYSTDGITWVGYNDTMPNDSSISDWVGLAYGNGRWVAVSELKSSAMWSTDGINWTVLSLPTQDGSTAHRWTAIKYGQGVFMAVGDTGGRDTFGDPSLYPTDFAITSEDGIVWTARTLATQQSWTSVAFGNPGGNPQWLAIASGTNIYNKVVTGARAKGRPVIASSRIGSVKFWDAGSGYVTPPTLTVIDPLNVTEASFDNRLGDGVISSPTILTSGTGYRTSTTTMTISGNGYADIIPVGKYVTITGMTRYPKVGSELIFAGWEDTIYTIVTIVELGNSGGVYSARFQISPTLATIDVVRHGLAITIREKFSQIRLTGHDFLSIGTGNFVQTNYPNVDENELQQQNEIVRYQGGRVFYTSSDQGGNFRVGELFAVEEGSGTVTLSADFFELNGLTELALGGVRLGGTGTVIREFSTDSLFTADSNNTVPTQKAIKAYVTRRLTIGGSSLSTGSVTAGVTTVGPNLITTTIGTIVQVPVRAALFGPLAGIGGSFLSTMMFYKSFKEDGQQR